MKRGGAFEVRGVKLLGAPTNGRRGGRVGLPTGEEIPLRWFWRPEVESQSRSES